MASKKKKTGSGKLSNIEIWNAKIDRTLTYAYLGKNGIHYEYLLPFGANRDKFYEEAEAVLSRKSPTTKYDNGKRPGQYQPIGEKGKNWFTFYQLKQLRKDGRDEYYVDMIKEILGKFFEEID